MKGNKLRQHYSLVNTVFYVFSPQTPSLVVQSTVRSFSQVNSIIPQNNTTRFATELQDKGIFNLESEYHSQRNSHGYENVVCSRSNRKLKFIKTYNNCKPNQACLPFTSSTKVASHL